MTLRRISLKRLALGKRYKGLKKSRLKTSNPERKARRRKGYAKMLSGKEYKAARSEAFRRAGDRCEGKVSLGGFGAVTGAVELFVRCGHTEGLHAHHLRYPKSRPLRASDLKVVCKYHHEKLEGEKLHKSRMF